MGLFVYSIISIVIEVIQGPIALTGLLVRA
jgi:hypothetical protein